MASQPVSFQINTKERRKSDTRAAAASVYTSSTAASEAVARRISDLIRLKAASRQKAVLGLATGSTPTGVYDALVRMHRDEKLSFHNVVTFNLDEYWPMKPEALQSYRRFMAEHLFDHIDIDPANVHIPNGDAAQADVAASCESYERMIKDAGGIDLQLLGIGRTGHIGFNEPGSSRESRTRLITLDKVTRMDAASDFFGEWNVPRRAITMGVGTILEAKRIILMAFGESKAKVIRQAIEGEITSAVAASFLQRHGDAEFILDAAAASELTKVKTPWLIGPLAAQGLAWDACMTRRAIIWLAGVVNKPILKLVGEDYNEHGLQELLGERGTAYDVNIEVFRSMQTTITGWPGGKPERVAGAPIRTHQASGGPGGASASEPFPKRIIVFSPHPDDDVISMGGTLIRLCEQGHEVHVAYQTSGNIAVFDEEAIRHAEFVTEFCRAFELISQKEAQRIDDAIRGSALRKVPGMVDAPELQRIKGLIRRTEARAAARFCGVAAERIHFLDLPFYETGRVRKRPLGDADIRIVTKLLETVRPHQVYAAGDLSDPHGTHRVCLAAVTAVFERLRIGTPSASEVSMSAGGTTRSSAGPSIRTPHGSGGPSASAASNSGSSSPPGAQPAAWIADCALWLYRGAWQEWEPDRIEMAVPLSPDEVERKRLAIFKHQSQKDRALFPGPSDPREFWQRAEDRNRATAELYDRLGLPEYQALEAFVRWRGKAE